MHPRIPDRNEIRLATFGETMLRFSPPEGERFETATELEFRTAGAESNVAIAASRLGTPTAWLSKLPETFLGRRVAADVQRHGVQPVICWTDAGRQGTYYIEPGGEPRGTAVVYDREHTAVRTATPDDLALEIIRKSDIFMVSGITPALSTTLAGTVEELLATAGVANTMTAFDINYRAKLWTPEEARETFDELLKLVDLLVVADRDAREVLDYGGDPPDLTAALADDYGLETVVLTGGESGAYARQGDEVIDQPAFEAETLDPIGSGDAFVGGLLAGLIAGDNLSTAMEYGAATAALKRTLAGDLAVVTPKEIEAVIGSEAVDIDR